MNNKILGYVLVAFLGLSTSVYAQDEQEGVNDKVARMTRELNLTDAQTDAVRPIIKEYLTKREGVVEATEIETIIDHEALRTAMKALKKDEYQKLSKVLSEDQMKRWIQREDLRAAFNKGDGESQVDDDGTALTPSGATLKF